MNKGIKTFEVRSAFFSATDNEALGGKEDNRHSQGSIFVKAETKADALATLKSFGYTTRTTDCRIGRGNGMDALLDAGVITTDSLTLVSLNDRNVGKVSLNESGEKVAVAIGHLKPVRTETSYGMEFEAL